MTETSWLASVLICTRNRSQVLRDCLESALAQELTAPWELIVVDNASTDDTADVARSVARAEPERVRVVSEPRLGLSRARNAAVEAARSDNLVFLDDDAFPEPGWLAALVGALGEQNVLAAGGPVIPLLEGELPDWFLGRFLPYISAWDLGRSPLDLHYNEYPRGANIGFRREVFARLGGFSPQLGRTGKRLLSCEEVELCLRVERAGGTVRYVPDARVRHRVAVDRMTPGWMLRRFHAQGRSEAILLWMHGGFAGLRRGLRDHRRNVREGRLRSGGNARHDLMVSCQRAALRGYRAGAVQAVLRTRRPPSPDGRSWTPS